MQLEVCDLIFCSGGVSSHNTIKYCTIAERGDLLQYNMQYKNTT